MLFILKSIFPSVAFFGLVIAWCVLFILLLSAFLNSMPSVADYLKFKNKIKFKILKKKKKKHHQFTIFPNYIVILFLKRLGFFVVVVSFVVSALQFLCKE